ncbi:MAG: NCS2 family permease [Kiritimatiellae bacterium]|nr:NCS2 family permease [Kiritimatiellia bacterium]MBQ6923523.1 NCS2 family permease [Kiritimatiellia bacterium]
MLEKLFRLRENKTTVRTEIVAGLTTFMTMAYILAVNPFFLSCAGMPKGGVLVATALAAFVGTMLMAAFANYPFVLAAGMGLNAYFAFTVCGDMGYSWPFALLAVFVEGLVFLALSVTPVREAIFNAIPLSLKKAVAAGIGLFITLIALKTAGILIPDQATYIKLVPFRGVPFHTAGIVAILALVGIVVTAVLHALRLKAAILLGILATWMLGVVAELTGLYEPDGAGFLSTIPHFEKGYWHALGTTFREFGQTFGAVFEPSKWTLRGSEASGWSLLLSLNFFVVMFAFFFVDLFDTLGTLIGVSLKGGFLDKQGRLPRISGALYADSVATSVGAVFGTSTTTTFVESSAGVAAGGKTGLTAATAAVLFLLSIFLAPIFLAIPGFATTPALVVVGFLMMGSIMGIDFNDVGEGLPSFLCIVAMPFFYSISDGIMFGVISYTFVNLCTGRAKRISPVMYVLTAIFIAKYALM